MRILVAGGAGFVGSHLVERLLLEGHRVLVVDNFVTGSWENVRRLREGGGWRGLEVLGQDVCEVRRIEDPVDAVLHLASPASPVDYLRHPLETLDAGAIGTRNLLDIARAHGARFLLASTSEVYGDPEVHPQPETYWGRVNPVGPRSVYDEAKRYAEAMTMAYARHAEVTVRIARIFNTYGPCMRFGDGRIIPTFVSQALRGLPLTVYGSGRQTRSYCYVDDLVRGLESLLWSDAEGPVNLGNPEEYSVLETAERVIEATGSRSRIVHLPLPEDDPQLRRPDITRARTLLGWAPRTSFREGLARTVEDARSRLERMAPVNPPATDGALTGTPEALVAPTRNGAAAHDRLRRVSGEVGAR